MSRLRVPVNDDDHVRGPRSAPITLVEYGDYQCPFCGAAYRELEVVRQTLGDSLRLIFRHFPLAELHPQAMQAAEAAEAGGAQKHFWAMHDALFQNQNALDVRSLIGHAEELGLDVERFAGDLEEHRYLPRIHTAFIGGVRSGVNATPNLFVNGRQYHGPITANALLETIRGERPSAVY